MPFTKAGREKRARLEESESILDLVKSVWNNTRIIQNHGAANASLVATLNTEQAHHRYALERLADELAKLRTGEDERWREFKTWMGDTPPAAFENNAQRGQRAFEAYASHAGWTAVGGHTIPPWDELGDLVQAHWIAAAAALDMDRS